MGNKLPTDLLRYPTDSIVSLVASLTELLYYLDVNAQIKGITKFCELPEIKIPRPIIVGGTKNPHLKRIQALDPELIIANREENRQEDIISLDSDDKLIWVTDINDISENILFIRSLGELLQNSRAEPLAAEMERIYSDVQNTLYPSSVAYLIWQEPYMVVANNTFINSMLAAGGFFNVFGDQERYPVTTLGEIIELAPQKIFLSSEPYPFNEAHLSNFETNFPTSEIKLVDGKMFSWYGSRPLLAKKYFETLT